MHFHFADWKNREDGRRGKRETPTPRLFSCRAMR
jgi:hypothetical protein